MLSSSTRNVVIVTGTIEGTDDDDLLPIDLTVDVTVDLGPTGDEEDTEIPRFESDQDHGRDGHRILTVPDHAEGPVRHERWHVRYRRRGIQYEQWE